MPPINLDEIVSSALMQPPRSNAVGRRRGRHRAAHIGHPLDNAARLLAQPRQPVVAIVVTDSDKLLAGDPEWVKLIEGITTACRAQHSLCTLYLINSGSAVPETLYTTRIDAVILIGRQADEAIVQIRARRPTALLIEPPDRS